MVASHLPVFQSARFSSLDSLARDEVPGVGAAKALPARRAKERID